MVNVVTEPQSRFMSHRASYIICLVTLVSVRMKSSLLFFLLHFLSNHAELSCIFAIFFIIVCICCILYHNLFPFK